MALPDPPRLVVTVGPTSTVVVDLDVRSDDWVTLQAQNLDPSQTAIGTIERRQSPDMEWSASTLGDFNGIQPAGTVDPTTGVPLDSVTADIPVEGTGYLRLVMQMSGAGGDVAACTRRGFRK